MSPKGPRPERNARQAPVAFIAGAAVAAAFADVPFAVLVVVFDVCLMVHSSAAPKLRSSHLE